MTRSSEAAGAPLSQEEGSIPTADGLRLYSRAWLPEEPKAALLFVHGLFEHSGRYDHTGRHFASGGYACHALDYRGHGRSPGARVHVDRFDDFLLDVRAALARIRARHPALPAFLVGHSHGGLIVLLYALRHPEGLPGIVLTSPHLGLHPATRPGAALAIASRLLSRALPSLRLATGLDPRGVSRDPAVVAAYLSDPLVGRKVSARWFTSVLGAFKEVHAAAGGLRVPALVMAAGDDRIVDLGATRRFVESAPPDLLEYVEWPGLYHELFNEPEREQVYARADAWLDARLTDGPSAPAG